METKVTTHIAKGLVIALALIVLDIIGYVANIKFEKWFGWIGLAILLGGIIYACVNFSNQKNNEVTFGNVFAHGFKTSVVVACIVFVYNLIAINFIFTDTIDRITEMAIANAEKVGRDVPSSALPMMKKIITITTYASGLIGALLVGVIASLIGAGVAKKNPPTPFQQP